MEFCVILLPLIYTCEYIIHNMHVSPKIPYYTYYVAIQCLGLGYQRSTGFGGGGGISLESVFRNRPVAISTSLI